MGSIFSKKNIYFLIIGLILLFGFLIRLKLFLDNPSFWFDESALGYNALALNFKEFFGVLHLQQVAPPLFLVISKLMTKIFGASDLVLRLFPFIIGNLAMILFLLILNQNFKNKFTIITGLILFCLNIQAIKFSVEFKPYILDLFSTCLILYTFNKLNWELSFKKLLSIGILFAFLPWFSFVSAGMLLVAIIVKFDKNYIKKIFAFISPILFSIVMLIFYYLNVRNFYGNFMTDFFKNSFFNLKEFPIQFFIGFDYLFNFYFAVIPFLLFFSGVIYSIIKKKHIFLVKFSLIVLIGYILCSFLKIYPFYDRFLLFLLPLILLPMLFIADILFEKKNILITIFTCLIFSTFLIPLDFFAKKFIFEPFSKDSCAKELFYTMAEKQKDDDVIVVDTLSVCDFLYYNMYLNLQNVSYLNVNVKDGIIQYKTSRNVEIPKNSKFDRWLYASWPSSMYPYLKYDYKKGCSIKFGQILYIKGNK